MSKQLDEVPTGTLAVFGGSEALRLAWAATTDQVGRVLALDPVVVEPDGSAAGSVEDMVALAGRTAGPLLVLPQFPPSAGGGSTPAAQVLVPFDGTDSDARRLRPLVALFRAGGVATVLMHALTEETRPRFWEGPGHHAEAWRNEVELRHGAEDDAELRISSDDPGRAVREQAGAVDLVAMVWGGDPSVERAAVVRAALGDAVMVPVLLLPAPWVDAVHVEGDDAPEGVSPDRPAGSG